MKNYWTGLTWDPMQSAVAVLLRHNPEIPVPNGRPPEPRSPPIASRWGPRTATKPRRFAAQHDWVSLGRHSEDTRDQAAALLAVTGPALPDGAARSAVTAAYLHDVGKAHAIWQDALCRLAPEERQAEIAAGRPWAKSGTVDLSQFRLGNDRSWTPTALGLRDRYGPFVLGYLETIVRIADWRASAGSEVAR